MDHLSSGWICSFWETLFWLIRFTFLYSMFSTRGKKNRRMSIFNLNNLLLLHSEDETSICFKISIAYRDSLHLMTHPML